MRTLYTAHVHVTGGRGHGTAKSSDGHLDIVLSTPGAEGRGTNPEQLLAAGWSACFADAIRIAAFKKAVSLPGLTKIDAAISLCENKAAFSLQAKKEIVIPGIARGIALQLLEEAKRTCPYTLALRSSVPTVFTLK